MGSIKTNIGTMSKGYFGTSPIKKIYFGSTRVFSAVTRYYTEGTKNVDWIKGSTVGSVDFYTSYMRVTTLASTSIVDAYAVTNSKVDLTNINTIYIDLSSSKSGTATTIMAICISSTKLGGYTAYSKRTATSLGAFGRQTLSVDVSGLSGSYYIRVHAQKGSSTSSSVYALAVYNVWGE